jgi:hypothetical protein
MVRSADETTSTMNQLGSGLKKTPQTLQFFAQLGGNINSNPGETRNRQLLNRQLLKMKAYLHVDLALTGVPSSLPGLNLQVRTVAIALS